MRPGPIVLAVESRRAYIPGMVETKPMTAEELERLYIPGKRVELVRGVPVVQELPSLLHGLVAGRLYVRLSDFVDRHDLGWALPECGFKIHSDPDTVRGPDVAFVSKGRLEAIPTRGYASLAPDLVVEVLSPGDRPGEVLEKVGQWLAAGARLAWVVDAERRLAHVFRADGTVTLLGPDDALEGEDVLPGFSLPLRDLL